MDFPHPVDGNETAAGPPAWLVPALWVLLLTLLVAVVGLPVLAVVLAVAVLTVQLGMAAMPAIGLRLRAAEAVSAPCPDRKVFLSVHVPTHNEPPEMVIATLQALARQKSAPPHEIIVLDNNTADPQVWQPLRDWCQRHGAPFRFFHAENVRGAKAGALNIALAKADPRCTHVVVVDADYRVTPDFLRTVDTALRVCDADFLQFPQAFAAIDPVDLGLAKELVDYFRRHARLADGGGTMLLTGTLSVISVPALRAVNGWSAQTATEDAEMGVRLLRAGFRGRYVDRIVGRGLMAFDLTSLKKQRSRWTKGNVSMLILTLQSELRQRRLDNRQLFLIAMQLTAWANLMLPALLLAGLAPLIWVWGAERAAIWVLALSMATIVVAMLTDLAPMLARARRQRWHPLTTRTALATRLSLQPTTAWSTIDALLHRSQSFAKTPKTIAAGDGVAGRSTLMLLLLAVATAALLALMGGGAMTLGLSLLLALMLGWCLVQDVSHRALQRYARSITQEVRP